MISLKAQLPLPEFYDFRNAARWGYDPDLYRVIQEAEKWKKQHRISSASADDFGVHLLLIDMQRDFCFPEGTLYVGGRSGNGAIEDNRRTAEFIYRELRNISRITRSLEAHLLYHIFSCTFWIDAQGNMITPNRFILLEDIKKGEVRPNSDVAEWICDGDYAWLCRQAEFYIEELERAGNYKLFIWLPHCIEGSVGQTMAGVVQEACMFHGFARGVQVDNEIKGIPVLTENYSIFGTEVEKTFDGIRLSKKNIRLLKTLAKARAVAILGEAASHCVANSVDDYLALSRKYRLNLASKTYIVTDCMSSVVIPGGPDFTAQAEAAFERFADAGVHLVKSTDPIESWPGLRKPV